MNINLANIDFCPGGKSATLTETTAEILLSETEKVIVPPEGTDGFNKVTITHAPVEESVSATITENGTHTITPSTGFGAMFGVNVDVNVSSSGDTMKYFNEKPTADAAGLKEIGWDDESVNYYKYNNYAYQWKADNYKVSDANKQIVINTKSDIATYKDNPDFQYCPKFDTSAETNMNGMFNGCSYLTTIPLLNTSNVTNMSYMFKSCSSLTNIPKLDTNKVTDISNMFEGCSSLNNIPQLDTHRVTTMNSMFYNCSSLASIPLLYTGKTADMSFMFLGCIPLASIPQLDTRSVTNMLYMFSGCSSLTTIPLFDTSNVTNMSGMFRGCSSLTSIPQIDTSKVTNINGMFYNCSSLASIPQLDTSKVTNMGSMFCNCSSLTTISQLDTSKVTNMDEMFSKCTSIISIPKLDATSLTTASNMFGYSWNSLNKFTDFGGLTNLKVNLDLSSCPKLTHDSLMNVINEAADVTASPKTLTLESTNLNKLTDEEKAIATNKGWVLN